MPATRRDSTVRLDPARAGNPRGARILPFLVVLPNLVILLAVVDFACDLKNRDARGRPNQLYSRETALALLGLTTILAPGSLAR